MSKTEQLISSEQIQQFNEKGYLILRQVIDPGLIQVFENYALMQRFNNYYLDDTETCSKWVYSDVFGESLMLYLQPMMEKLAERELYPTNTVLRIYQKGGKLRKHVDRPTCEYSITLTVGYESKEVYPIWVRSAGKDIAIDLDRGDMLIYKGCEILHWREKFGGHQWIQLFLHYVDATGQNARYKYDGRIMVGLREGKILSGKQAV